MHTSTEAFVSSRRNTGFWRNNQTYLAHAGFRIQPKTSPGFHAAGTSLYYEKEGNYLRRYRGYLQYAYHARLNDTWKLSAGASVGIMTYQVGNEDYNGGTGTTVDGSFSMMLYSNKTYLGAVIGQLPEKSVQPIQEITILARYYQFLAKKDIELSPHYLLRSNVNTLFYMSARNPDLFVQSGILWNKTIGLYALYQWDKKAALILSIEKIEIEDMCFRTSISYDMAFRGDARQRAIEICLHFVMPEKEKK